MQIIELVVKQELLCSATMMAVKRAGTLMLFGVVLWVVLSTTWVSGNTFIDKSYFRREMLIPSRMFDK